VDTFARVHHKDIARQAGSAATKAEDAKSQKYHDLQSNYRFQPVAMETTGGMASPLPIFWAALQKKLVDMSGDPREHQWLHQSSTSCSWLCSKETLSAYWPAWKFDLTSSVPLAPMSMCNYCLPNPHSFWKFHCSLSCAVLTSCQSHSLCCDYSVVLCSTLLETSEATKKEHPPHCPQRKRLHKHFFNQIIFIRGF